MTCSEQLSSDGSVVDILMPPELQVDYVRFGMWGVKC
jgi:hypothetical protein